MVSPVVAAAQAELAAECGGRGGGRAPLCGPGGAEVARVLTAVAPRMNENHLVAFAVDILTDIYKSRFLIISLSNLK